MMCDSNLLAKVSGGIDIVGIDIVGIDIVGIDSVAIEAKYHLIVLFSMYHNQLIFLSKPKHGQLLSW